MLKRTTWYRSMEVISVYHKYCKGMTEFFKFSLIISLTHILFVFFFPFLFLVQQRAIMASFFLENFGIL